MTWIIFKYFSGPRIPRQEFHC